MHLAGFGPIIMKLCQFLVNLAFEDLLMKEYLLETE